MNSHADSDTNDHDLLLFHRLSLETLALCDEPAANQFNREDWHLSEHRERKQLVARHATDLLTPPHP